VTDHNSCGNVESAMKVADGNILVIPGMEIETSEEIHVVSYFPDLERAKEAENGVRSAMSGIKNRPEIFGNQYFMDENDEIVVSPMTESGTYYVKITVSADMAFGARFIVK
jgi:hypothetical protein